MASRAKHGYAGGLQQRTAARAHRRAARRHALWASGRAALELTVGRVSGSDGCNQFTGKVSLGESQRIEFSELASTRMACPNMEDAKRVTDMLDTAYRYLIDHDRLVFFGPDSRVLGGWREAN